MRKVSVMERSGRSKGSNSYGCLVGMRFSARRNESVATNTKAFPSGYRYTLLSSGLIELREAAYHTALRPRVRSVFLMRSDFWVTVGSVGKSSGESVLMVVVLVGVLSMREFCVSSQRMVALP